MASSTLTRLALQRQPTSIALKCRLISSLCRSVLYAHPTSGGSERASERDMSLPYGIEMGPWRP